MAESEANREEPLKNQVPAAAVESQADASDHAKLASMSNISFRGLGAFLAGLAGGVIGWFTGKSHASNQMLEFETEVNKQSVQTITGRGGLGAAIADTTSIHPSSGLPLIGGGSLGPGYSAHLVQNNFETQLLLHEPQKYKFANWMRRLGGGNIKAGEGVFSFGTGLVGALALGLGYLALAPKKKTVPVAANNLQAMIETPEASAPATAEKFAKKWQGKIEQRSISDNEVDQMANEGKRLGVVPSEYVSEYHAAKNDPEKLDKFIDKWEEKIGAMEAERANRNAPSRERQ